MPYIKERRKELNPVCEAALSSGELNYQITRLILTYWEAMAAKKGQYSYVTINDIMGALEGAKLEFYRRVAAPYEDAKILENGDVYE